jgi:hypothetical protein
MRICEAISRETRRSTTQLDHKVVVTKLNRMMNGWANYFHLGPVSKAYQAVDQHACRRLRRWLCNKHKVSKPGTGRFPDEHLYGALGLIRLPERTRSFSWAKS